MGLITGPDLTAGLDRGERISSLGNARYAVISPCVFLKVNLCMGDHFPNLASAKQVQWTLVIQRLTLREKIPHHTPLILAAEDLQQMSDPC
jgi:hypothetical protein